MKALGLVTVHVHAAVQHQHLPGIPDRAGPHLPVRSLQLLVWAVQNVHAKCCVLVSAPVGRFEDSPALFGCMGLLEQDVPAASCGSWLQKRLLVEGHEHDA
mmetsp:Transcript_51444/g.119931  ORF Transcript_51444/g.119931 Transcript_51444/m.119931 type:complete len:101 (-) Transcript_51444:644-946(-)